MRKRSDAEVEAAAEAIWDSETSRVIRDEIYQTNAIPWNDDRLPPKVWKDYRKAARNALEAADVVAGAGGHTLSFETHMRAALTAGQAPRQTTMVEAFAALILAADHACCHDRGSMAELEAATLAAHEVIGGPPLGIHLPADQRAHAESSR